MGRRVSCRDKSYLAAETGDTAHGVIPRQNLLMVEVK